MPRRFWLIFYDVVPNNIDTITSTTNMPKTRNCLSDKENFDSKLRHRTSAPCNKFLLPFTH